MTVATQPEVRHAFGKRVDVTGIPLAIHEYSIEDGKRIVCGLPIRPAPERIVQTRMSRKTSWEFASLVGLLDCSPIMLYCGCGFNEPEDQKAAQVLKAQGKHFLRV